MNVRPLLRVSPVLTLLGLAGLIVTFAFSFERPNGLLLGGSAILIVASPLLMAVDLLLARDLSRGEKREVMNLAFSRHAGSVLEEYGRSRDRRAGLQRLRQSIRPDSDQAG